MSCDRYIVVREEGRQVRRWPKGGPHYPVRFPRQRVYLKVWLEAGALFPSVRIQRTEWLINRDEATRFESFEEARRFARARNASIELSARTPRH